MVQTAHGIRHEHIEARETVLFAAVLLHIVRRVLPGVRPPVISKDIGPARRFALRVANQDVAAEMVHLSHERVQGLNVPAVRVVLAKRVDDIGVVEVAARKTRGLVAVPIL
jgi:hypothetical protein